MKSTVKAVGTVTLPEWAGTRVYMLPYTKGTALPIALSKWQKTIDTMLEDINTTDLIHITIDQKHVAKGNTQRVAGKHIDGNYIREKSWDTGGGRWNTRELKGGGIILASSVYGCDAYVGTVKGSPKDKGNCSHIDTTQCVKVPMRSNNIYVGNVTMIHEPRPMLEECDRTLVRITLPETYKEAA